MMGRTKFKEASEICETTYAELHERKLESDRIAPSDESKKDEVPVSANARRPWKQHSLDTTRGDNALLAVYP